MPRFSVNNSQGYTFAELAIVVVILGILSSFAASSFIALYERNKVSDGLAKVQGALLEAQRQAMRRSMNCSVTIPTGTNVTISSSTSCLITGDRTLSGNTTIFHTISGSTVTFDYRGRTTTSNTIRISTSNTGLTKCITLSSGIGLMRSGVYTAGNSPPCTSSR